ncbi:MAG TPA: enoyl-ACP reductase FabI [Nitrospira sp.]|nr:enoyl-ACP reductase FabI [Nitrospira sp.]
MSALLQRIIPNHFKGMIMNPMFDLTGKIGLVTGIANEKSISTGVAEACVEAGAKLVITYQNEKTRAFIEPVVHRLGVEHVYLLDVTRPETMDDVHKQIDAAFGKLDFAIHSMAFAKRDDLHGRVVDTSADGFAMAMDISTHSFIRLAKLVEPLMEKAGGGSLITMTYLGSEKVIANYGVMGLCKAALEAGTRYLAYELGSKNIRVNAVSPGPLMTRAASGIAGFDGLMSSAVERSPMHSLVTPEDIGALTAFLVSDAGRLITGGIHFVDAGYNIVG